jgi:hypothetical protein
MGSAWRICCSAHVECQNFPEWTKAVGAGEYKADFWSIKASWWSSKKEKSTTPSSQVTAWYFVLA